MSTHNLCFEQKCEKYQNFSSENFHFLVVKFSVYLNRRVFVMHPPCLKFMQCYAENWCPAHDSETVWNIFMKIHRWLNYIEVMYLKKEDNSALVF